MVAVMQDPDPTPGPTNGAPSDAPTRHLGAVDRPGHLSPEDTEAFGAEMDRLRQEILAARGQQDADYIHRVISLQRRLEAAGRLALFAGILPPAWVAGTTLLATAKILENMEIGHNVMHGQWDWMRDPEIHSTTWEWDNACPSSQWKHSHNEVHHVWTNVVGMDRDVGYGILRMSEDQPWTPATVAQPVYAAVLAALFQWGVALHDVEVERVLTGRGDTARARERLREVGRKGGRQVLKDYVAFPALAGPFFLPVLTGNLVANLARNIWSFTIIFCGHFPSGVQQFTPEQVAGRDAGRLVRPPGPGVGQHLRRAAAGPDVRQPQLPDRAPRVPGPAQQPLRRGGAQGGGALRALRHPVRHRLAAPPVRLGGEADRQVRAARIGRAGVGRLGP